MDLMAAARSFHDRGILFVDHLFDVDRLDEIEAELARFIEQLERQEAASWIIYEPGSERKIRNIFDMQKYDAYFARLAEAPELVQLAQAIFADEPILKCVELFGKPARVGSEVPFHQDNAYFNLVPDDAITIWLALADATLGNGCVRYLEGSHKLGNLPHMPSGVKGNSMRLSAVPPAAGREVCGIVKRGGALIHHCNTIHRSDPNRSDLNRPGLLFVYQAARCRIDESRAAHYREVMKAVR